MMLVWNAFLASLWTSRTRPARLALLAALLVQVQNRISALCLVLVTTSSLLERSKAAALRDVLAASPSQERRLVKLLAR